MGNLYKLRIVTLIPIALLLGGCPIKDRLNFKSDPTEEIQSEVKLKETLEVSISCNRETIQKYLDEGWEIVDSSTSEVACSWKTKKANDDCDITLDKGCRITVPDILGEEILYILEREQ
ncbi:hypothetical protein [Prochlorococcus marinus]|uniref:Possible Alpha-2-macroglobulin family N-termin n=1 Tax=Prochlorococcus marinus (strain MIT 9211) TaxID=93059 RepID=A9BAA2_PROM4|nr:hypothetical protein [Prochlorococcus marinus]ABX08764.1 possible Alpha-2-macroglobulin family N-termin [Prochlorococcus marinus str. MIT 9211]